MTNFNNLILKRFEFNQSTTDKSFVSIRVEKSKFLNRFYILYAAVTNRLREEVKLSESLQAFSRSIKILYIFVLRFPMIGDSVYIRRHVTDEKRQLVREMLVIIQNKFIRMLHDALSIRREYRQIALARLQELRFMIGGPDEIFDEFQFADNVGLYGVRVLY